MKKLMQALLLGAAISLTGAGASNAEPIRLKMGSTFPSGLVQLGTLGKQLEENINLLAGDSIKVKFFEPGALVPALELFDAIKSGAVDAGWSAPGYWQGKEPAVTLFTTVPFGPSAGEYLGWIYYGGGEKMMQEIYARHNIRTMICGIISPEASGWFRKPIESVEDLKGLKMRFFGLGAKVMQKLGVDTQLLAAADIYPALERGTIDATEFSMPAIDLKLGFYQIAKNYYFPGWHQQSTLLELMINMDKWNAMDAQQQAIITTACRANVTTGLAEGEAIQGAALKELQAKGVTLHKWSPEMLDIFRKTWEEVAAEQAAGNADFKKGWESLQAYRKEYAVWKDYGFLK
ncbi:TRAP transporter solute receptor, unknown substrate 6 [hydrothermal vent metagenome]|uniref:TRAP-type C4-dicarboxylate transport system, periplasmic component n=1 Tax=hydrothermal vent metagenome TaxID=652676 RepID=A0A3B0T8F4_9ZZZZ